MKAALTWIPFLSLLKKECKRFFRVIGQTVLTPMVNSALYLLIFGVSIGERIGLVHEISYIAFLIPGLMMMGTVSNSFQNASSSLSISKFNGDLEDIKAAPLTANQIVWAMSMAATLRGMLVSLVIFVIGQVFVYVTQGAMIGVHSIFLTLLFLMCAGLSFGGLGLFVGFLAKSFDQISAVSTFLLVPFIYLGGVFFSLEHLHPFWIRLAHYNPMFYFINGIRYGILGISDVDLQKAFMVVGLSCLLFYAMAYLSVKKGTYHRW